MKVHLDTVGHCVEESEGGAAETWRHLPGIHLGAVETMTSE